MTVLALGLLAATVAARHRPNPADVTPADGVSVTVPADLSDAGVPAPTVTTTGDRPDVGGTGTPWPSPPADPSAAVLLAMDDAEAAGVHEAVVIIDRVSGAILTQQNADQQFPALSLVKLMIAADVLTGSGEAAQPDVATLVRLREMIARSDDEIAADMYEQAGGDAMVDRVVQRYGLIGSAPTPDGEYWGNVQTTAADMASLLSQLLAGPATAPVVRSAMLSTTVYAQDGVDQRIGMRVVPGAGSKQGWGCCLSGVVGIHSVGFTPERIVVVLSVAEPDDDDLANEDGLALQSDPGGQVSIAAVTATVRAALGGPSS